MENKERKQNFKMGISRNRAELLLLSTLIVISFSLCAICWLTEVFNDAIVSRLQLRNGSLSFAWWQRPMVRAVYRIYVFNYSNVEEFEAGQAEKLRVKETGPYVYRETIVRMNPMITEHLDEISYQEMRSYQWEGGSPDDDQVIVPNVPLFTAMAFARDMSFIAQISLTAILSTIRSKPFLKLPLHSFLWGYDDELFRLAKPLISWQQNIPYDNFGMLAFKAGLSKDRLTISSGIKNIKNLGNTIYFNGRSNRNIWHDKECDKIEGSDGSMFPPPSIRDHACNIKFYAKEMCRSIPLEYYGRSYTKGIPSLRYKLSEDVFTFNASYNTCFCQNKTDDFGKKTSLCAPKGIFNTSACNFGAPMLSSLPHFYQADKSLLDYVDGLKPKKNLHETYVDIHPRLAVPIGGWSRVQVNMEVRKADAVPFLGRLKDGTILPILWIEIGIDEIPDSVMNILYHTYYTANTIEACLQWGSLLSVLLSVFLFMFVRCNQLCTGQHNQIQQNIYG